MLLLDKQIAGNTTRVDCFDFPSGLCWVELVRNGISLGGKRLVLNRRP